VPVFVPKENGPISLFEKQVDTLFTKCKNQEVSRTGATFFIQQYNGRSYASALFSLVHKKIYTFRFPHFLNSIDPENVLRGRIFLLEQCVLGFN